jgi:hypothetical protein
MRKYTIVLKDDDGAEVEIGTAKAGSMENGNFDIKMHLFGDCVMASDNISGMTRLRCIVPESLRKG